MQGISLFDIKKSKAIISFNYVDGGLTQKGKKLKEFYIAGNDKKFYPAKGDTGMAVYRKQSILF